MGSIASKGLPGHSKELRRTKTITVPAVLQKPNSRLRLTLTFAVAVTSMCLVSYRVSSSPLHTFGSSGYRTFDLNGDDRVQDAVLTDSGKIALVVNSYHLTSLVQLNDDGSMDANFGTNGVTSLISSLTNLTRSSIDVLQGGKLLVSNSSCYGCFTRFLNSGAIDSSFGSGGTISVISASGQTSNNGFFWLRPIWSKSDNTFLTMQYFVSQTGYQYKIKKFKLDLTLDNSFGVGGIVDLGINPANGQPRDWFVKGNGQIAIASNKVNEQGRTVSVFELRQPNGQLDTGFGIGGSSVRMFMNADTRVDQVTMGPDGSIWGQASNDSTSNFMLIKLTASGSSDPYFGIDGIIDTGIPKNDSAISPLSDGGVIYATRNYSQGLRTYRFTASGTLDASYRYDLTSQIVPEILVTKVIVDQLGQSIVVGQTTRTTYDAAVVRFGDTGILDSPMGWLAATSTVPPSSASFATTTSSTSAVTSSTSPVQMFPTITNPTGTPTPTANVSVSSNFITIGSIGTSTKWLASHSGLSVLETSRVSAKVLPTYEKYCKIVGATLKGLRTGTCKVSVTVTPKRGKAITKTITLKIKN